MYTQLHKVINPFFIWHRTKKDPSQTNTMLCPNNSLNRHFQFAKPKKQHAKPRGQCSHNNKDFCIGIKALPNVLQLSWEAIQRCSVCFRFNHIVSQPLSDWHGFFFFFFFGWCLEVLGPQNQRMIEIHQLF